MEPIDIPAVHKTRKIPSKFSILKRNAEIDAEKNGLNQNSSNFSHMNEIGKEIGLEIWKIIDNDTIQKVPKMNHSIFETNKSYLLLMSQFHNGDLNVKNFNIHFWIGELLIDSHETISYCNDRIEELERIVKNNNPKDISQPEPILYREFQGKEGGLFMSYFKNHGGPRYVPPLKLSNTSGSSSTTAAAAKQQSYKLFHLKGRRNIRVKQVECSSKSLNSGDVFVLDCDDFIFQWNGIESGRMEKSKGLDLTVRLRDEKSAKAKIIVMDENDTDNEYPEFWKRLNGSKVDVNKADVAGDDFDYEKKSVDQIKLYQVENLNDEVHLHQIDPINGAYSTNQLKSEFCYILDCETELYVWLGKGANSQQKTMATNNAMDLLHHENRPSWTSIIKMSQGSENTLFKDKFKNGSWGEFVNNNFDKKPVNGKGVASKLTQEKVNVDALHNPQKYEIAKEVRKSVIPTLHHVDENHKGELKIWHVRMRNKFEIPSSEFGLFYAQSCYLVLFTLFSQDGTSNSVLYIWQGTHSQQQDKATAALISKDVGKELNRHCIHVRIVQNKEPHHFLEHFKGRMVVFRDARALSDTISIETVPTQGLYHVKGTDEINTNSIQVNQKISNLNSNDSFILINSNKSSTSYIWVGKYSDEKDSALSISRNVFGSTIGKFELITEGQEPNEFWELLEAGSSAISEKVYYNKLRTVEQEKNSRLFQCSNNSGVFRVFEIHDFIQDDLDSDDVMILDDQKQIFVWIGKESSDTEKQMSMETASEYLLNAPGNRKEDPVYRIEDGNEPIEFTSNFHAWEVNKVQEDSYKSKLNLILRGNKSPTMLPIGGLTLKPTNLTNKSNSPVSVSPKPTTTIRTPVSVATPTPTPASTPTPTPTPTPVTKAPTSITNFYSLSVLKQKSTIPSDVDQTNIHLYLSNEEFLSVFKVDKDAFQKLPAWRQKGLRQSNGLF